MATNDFLSIFSWEMYLALLKSVNCLEQLQTSQQYRENERHFINHCRNAVSFPLRPHLLNSFFLQVQELSTPRNWDLPITIMTQFAAVGLLKEWFPLQQTCSHFRVGECVKKQKKQKLMREDPACLGQAVDSEFIIIIITEKNIWSFSRQSLSHYRLRFLVGQSVKHLTLWRQSNDSNESLKSRLSCSPIKKSHIAR